MATPNRPKKGHAQSLGGKGCMANHRRAADAFMDLSDMDGGEDSDKENADTPPLFKAQGEKKRNAGSPLKEKMQPVAKKATVLQPRQPLSPIKKQQAPQMEPLLSRTKRESAGKEAQSVFFKTESPLRQAVQPETSKEPNKKTGRVATASEAAATAHTLTTTRPSPSTEELHIHAELQKQTKPQVLQRILNNSIQRREEIKARIADLKVMKGAVGAGAEATDITHEINALNVEGKLVVSLSCLAQLRLGDVEGKEKILEEAASAGG